MIILGIDPGLAIVGYGIVEYQAHGFRTLAYGAITTPAHTPVEERLAAIYDGMSDLITMYHPAEMAIEELFFTKNITTGISVAEARGVALLAAKKKNVSIFEYTPMQVKQAVVGYGGAEKKQVQMMVKTILKLEKMPKLDDTADALAIAICHAHTGGSRIRQFYNIR
ncbi:MAG: crossover junction endodeoxyribonuclease RuvC [Ruminococcaceae bacterium]|nr:crossover junction endodeoxyribonuclease RuvC [Oscillospiraceae bacterium]